LRPSHFILLLACALAAGSAARARADDPRRDISFRNDVMAVLSKAGCNAGACHGNKSGKGGLKLSLRGQDPELDYLALTSDLSGRRINAIEPDKSLILLKPTTQVAHEGGSRFKTDSPEYQILRRWIGDRMPRDSASTPALVRLDVMPGERVLIEPADQVQIKAIA